ncbi:2 TM domain-containing transmembrane protein RAD4 [Acrasis kona]|uniref:2 TM domain-containing transmembrane protein RAD4 n=1 Tax=Acrasis kona TaxID=1008807 RepID=A0AAW2ZGD0_9EUKA
MQETGDANPLLKRKIAILLFSLCFFTLALIVLTILHVKFVPDGDLWWAWLVWSIWGIVFTIGVVEVYNSIKQINAVKKDLGVTFQTLMDEEMQQTNRQSIQENHGASETLEM